MPRVIPAKPICGEHATRISVDGANDMLFLIAGVDHLSEGPVTAIIHNARFLYPGERVKVGGEGTSTHFLEAYGHAIPEIGGVAFLNYTLGLRRGREYQQLASFERRTLGNPTVLVWAGDVDRDMRCSLT